MDKESRKQAIIEKCAGCQDKAHERHYALFVNEHWDPHPPKEFVEWLHAELPIMDPERARERMEAELENHVGKFAGKLREVLEGFISRAEAHPHRTVRRYDTNPVAAWNSDRFRQEYFRAIGLGEATAPMEQMEMA